MTGDSDQLALVGPRGGLLPKAQPRDRGRALAGAAQVVLDTPVPSLDRIFDFGVPAALHDHVQFGVKVRVRVGRQRMAGWVVGRTAPERADGLKPIESVLIPEPQLTHESLALCRAVADHYLGTLSDVLRLAIPARHAAAAAEQPALVSPSAVAAAELAPGPGRWVWTCPAGQDWATAFAGALAAAAAGGGRGLAVVPDARDVARLRRALDGLLPAGCVAPLTAGVSAASRYRAFLAALRGEVPVVIGTRSAAFAPLPQPDLLLLWDDGDDSHAERRAPYPHAREVLAMRSTPGSCFLVGGYSRSTNTERWLEIGWAAEYRSAPRPRLRVRATDDDSTSATPAERAARIPPAAGAAIRRGLAQGPVLVSVGRRGYVPRLCCRECGQAAQCRTCGGALRITSGHAAATCGRCGGLAGDWSCPACGCRLLRSVAVGSERTAEELGRAFPGVKVVSSTGDRIVESVPAAPALVVATPGAEPIAASGYAAVVLLDVRAALNQPGLRGAEQAVRRWFNAGGLARPGAELVVVGEPGLPGVQALMRWDPGWFAARELAERRAARMPPAAKAVSLVGPPPAIAAITDGLPATVLGPVPVQPGRERALVVVAHREAKAVLAELRTRLAARSARGSQPVQVQVDPVDLL